MYCRLIASMSSVTPFLAIAVSSSLTISSKVKPYWKPEQPPPCTKTRSFRSGFPSSSTSSLTLLAALSVKTSGGGGSSPWDELTMWSATALMHAPGRREPRLSAKRRIVPPDVDKGQDQARDRNDKAALGRPCHCANGDQRLLNCFLRRAPCRPTFLRSTSRASRVTKPARLRSGLSAMS